MNNIRYKINTSVHTIKLFDIETHENIEPVIHFDHYNHTYFVNILENPGQHSVKCTIYMPDGETHTGWIFLDYISLHPVGNVFDGRFNI